MTTSPREPLGQTTPAAVAVVMHIFPVRHRHGMASLMLACPTPWNGAVSRVRNTVLYATTTAGTSTEVAALRRRAGPRLRLATRPQRLLVEQSPAVAHCHPIFQLRRTFREAAGVHDLTMVCVHSLQCGVRAYPDNRPHEFRQYAPNGRYSRRRWARHPGGPAEARSDVARSVIQSRDESER